MPKRKVPVKPVEVDEESPVVRNSKEKPAKKHKNEPDYMAGDGKTVATLILSIQKTDRNNAKIIKDLTKLYQKMGHVKFSAVFMEMVWLFLMRDENDEFAPRVLKFIGVFVASFGEEVGPDGGSHALITNVFSEILKVTSKLYHVRARICQLVAYIMTSFSQRAEIDTDIMDSIVNRMITTFIKDISPLVRQHAIMALQRLQNPDSSDDPVTRAYIFHMETDPASKVRQAAITAIAKKLHIFPNILERLHDIDEKVRRHTYLQMASFPVKMYKIADRIKIMEAWLYDRSDVVKKAVSNILLPNWIAAYEQDYTEFIKAIKMDSSESELLKFRHLAQEALTTIFKKQKIAGLVAFLKFEPDDEFKNCLAIEKTYSLEWLIVWKIIIKFQQNHLDNQQNKTSGLNNEDGESSSDEQHDTEVTSDIMPELSVFCDYVEKFLAEFKLSAVAEEKYQKLTFNHCIIVLLEIAQMNDFGDEIGCNRLKALLKKILLEHEVSENVIKEVARVMEKLVADVTPRLGFFVDIISQMVTLDASTEYSRQEIVEDLIKKANIDTQVKANQLKMEMMELKEKEKTYVEQKLYTEAQRVSEQYVVLSEKLIELLRPFAEESNGTSQSLVDSLSSVVVAKKVSPADILKNLQICYYAITMKGMKVLTPEVVKIYNNFVCYHTESTEILTRVSALKAATACSLLYEPLAKDVYAILKSQMFKSNNVVIWEAAITCIVDLLLRYSLEKMDHHDDVNASVQNRSKKGGRSLYTDDGEDAEEFDIVASLDIVQMLTHVIDNNLDKKVHLAAVVGVCKLIIHGQHCTRDIMSKFLLSYFNPATDTEISQTLGIFFEAIVRMKRQESLHNALTPTLITLLEAPSDSPLREVKMETVIRYVIGATRPVFCANGLNLHNVLGLHLLELMKDNPANKDIPKVFSKELLTLEIGDDPLLKTDMVALIEVVLSQSTFDVRTKKNIINFRDMLNGTYREALKFSSTARTTVADEDDDAGIPEEEDDEELEDTEVAEGAAERFSRSEVLDCSASQIVMHPAVVNVTKLSNARVNTPNESAVEPFENISMVSTRTPDKNIPGTPSRMREIEETQTSFEEAAAPGSHDEEIPMTQAEEEIESSSDDEQNETVIEGTAVESSEDIPETPEPKSARAKRSAVRQLDLSLSTSSPLRKNPRNGKTPKTAPSNPTPRTPSSTSRIGENSTSPRTRRQAKEDLATSSTLTRSASKNMNVDPVKIAEKVASTKQAAKPPAEKPLKKALLPVPTKTSLIRSSKAVATAAIGKAAGKTAKQAAGPSVPSTSRAAAGPSTSRAAAGAEPATVRTLRRATKSKVPKPADTKSRWK